MLALSAGVCVSGQEKLQVLHGHVRRQVAEGKAQFIGTMPEDERLSFSIILPLRNQPELDRLLARLYDASSPDYRQFLSVAEFTARFGPSEEDYAAVVAFARASGFEVTGAPVNRLIVPASATVEQINSAFHIRMGIYQHPTENRTFFSPDREPSLAVSAPVTHVAGLNNFSLPRPLVKRSSDGQMAATVTGSGPGGSYLGSDMRAAYYGGTQLTGNGQTVGLLEFGGYYLSDVDATFSNAQQSYTVAINNVLIDGAFPEPVGGGDDAEQVLDIVQAIGMAPGLSQVRVYIGDPNERTSDDANVLNAMAAENIAKALSCSWSWIPDDPETDDVFFKEFAAQGQSFFAASGDDGAFDILFDPYVYPQEDAYVTAVGGTHLTTQGAGGAWDSESAWNSPPSGSGGGISPDNILIPDWQFGLATVANRGSTTLRNVPDVAMEGDFDNYDCAQNVCAPDYGGTSFAAPRWAAFIALANQQAVEAGTAPQGGVGFINPYIYLIGKGSKYVDDFHDIVSGNNLTFGQPFWFSTEAGYDLVTGWGSPTGQDLIDDLAGKQTRGFWLSASSPNVVMNPGASGSTTISVIDAGGFTGNVQLAITSQLPSGVTAKWRTNPTSNSSVLTLTSANTVANTTVPFTITGTSGSLVERIGIVLTVHTPSFSLSTLPASVAMKPDSSASASVLVTPLYGFTGSVKLSVTGLPKGVTATLGTNPTTGSSQLTFNASSSAAPGTNTVTITGVSGSVTAKTTLTFSIHLPSFELYAYYPINLGPGVSGETYISIYDEFGFTGNVRLSVAGLPKGVTASFGPNPAAFYSTLILTAAKSAALGSSTLTVTGVSGTARASTTLKLNVLPPEFLLFGPPQIALGQGKTMTSTIQVEGLYGFENSVNLSISGLPNGVTASLVPNPAIGNATLTLTASSTATPASSTVTITGTSGSLKATTSFPVGVYVPTFVFTAMTPVVIGPGTSAASSISVVPEYGFTDSVHLDVLGLPKGVTAAVSPNPVTGTAEISLSASASAPLGASTLTITGTSGKQIVNTPLSLSVLEPTFTLTGSGPVSVGQGSSANGAVTVTPEYGFLGSVELSASGLPSGVTASFSPNPTAGQSILSLAATSTAKIANSGVTVIGTYGGKKVTTTIPLSVVEPGFTLTNQDGPVNLGRGASVQTYISMSPQNGFTGNVRLSVSGLPSGVTASFSPDLIIGSGTLTLTANTTATIGTKNITVKGISGAHSATTTIPLTVAAPSFTVDSPGPLTIYPGMGTTAFIYVNPSSGFTGSVKLSASRLPAGVIATFSPNPTNSGSTLTLAASNTVALGTKTVTIKGTWGSKTSTITFPLTVSDAAFTLSGPGSLSLAPGNTTSGTIQVYSPDGLSGDVHLSVSGMPRGVTATLSPNPISAYSSSTLTLTAAATAVQANATLTITGTSGKLTASTTVQLQVHAPAFYVSAYPSMTVAQGGKATGYVNVVSEFGFTGTAKLSIAGLPEGVTASWIGNPTANNSQLVLTATKTAPLQARTVTITGTSRSLTASTTLQVIVQAPTFSIESSYGVIMDRGTSAFGYILVLSNGFDGDVDLSISGLPSGVTATFSPGSTSSSSTVTLTATSSAALGQYNAVVTGTYGKLSSATLLNLTVNPADSSAESFTLSTYGNAQVGRGSSTTATVNVNPANGFTGSVQLSATNLPSGVTASFTPNPSARSSYVTLTASDTAALGEYNVTIIGVSGKLKATIPMTVSIYAPTFTVSSYVSDLLQPGSSTQGSVYIQPLYGFLGSVNLSVSGLPQGVTASFLPNPVSNSSTITLTASKSVSQGQYNLIVTGVSGNQKATSVMPLTVAAASFSLYSAGVGVGQGSSAQTFVTVVSGVASSSPVQLQVSDLPSGVTASISPNPTTYSSNLTLTASKASSLGQYAFTIKGSSAGKTVAIQSTVDIERPSFSLYGPGTVSLGQGASTTASVSINSQFGFNSAVGFSVIGLPDGVTAAFSPNPTANSSTITLAASSSAPAGTYAATILGKYGTQSATSVFNLTVGPPGFTLNGGTEMSLGQGSSSTNDIYLYPQFGFSGLVQFSASGLPAGVTASFSPSSSSSNTVLTLTAASTAVPGNYLVTVSGASGAAKSTMMIGVTVGSESFTLQNYGLGQIGQGSTGTTFIEVNPSFGFHGAVQMSAVGLPAGVTASFSPNPAVNSTVLTLSVPTSIEPGQYTFTVKGTSGKLTAFTQVVFTVSVPYFSLDICCGVDLGRGASATATVNLYSQNGFTGEVQLAISGLPSGVTAAFSQNPTKTGSMLTLTASSTASLGQYNITVTGESGTQTVSSTETLTVHAPTFQIAGAYGGVTVGRGSTATTSLYTTAQYGFAGNIQFTAAGLPSGVTVSFSPNPSTAGTTLTVTASPTATLGQYNMVVTGTAGSQSALTVIPVSIYVPTFTIQGYDGITIGQGTTTTTSISVIPEYGFTGKVQFAAPNLPAGMTASFSPDPATDSTTMTLTASATAALGEHNIVVTGTSGSQSASTTISVGVVVPTFTISDYSDIDIGQGTTGTTNVYVYGQYGFSGNVEFAVSGLPTGVTASFSPNPAASTTTLTLTASSTAPIGQSTLTITGTSGTQTASTKIMLGVFVPTFVLADYYSVTLSPGGQASTSYVSITGEYGFTGNVQLSAGGLPSGVTASFSPNPTPAGTASLTLQAGSSAAAGQYTVTITGTSGSQTSSTNLPVTID